MATDKFDSDVSSLSKEEIIERYEELLHVARKVRQRIWRDEDEELTREFDTVLAKHSNDWCSRLDRIMNSEGHKRMMQSIHDRLGGKRLF